MKYNFDQIINRKGTDSIKYDKIQLLFNADDLQPLWVADMDFASPPFIIEALKKRMEHPILGYTMRTQQFFEAFKHWAKKRYQWEVKTHWLDFSPGVVAALNIAILSLTEKNDEIIIQPPVYHPFFKIVTTNNRILVENPLQKDENGHYHIDFDDLQQKINRKTKMIIISNPHNPVGRVWKKNELEQLGKIAVKNNLIILSDDIHADFVYQPYQYIPLASISPSFAQQCITVTSPSKTFNIAGLSTSVVVIPNKKIKEKYTQKLNDMHLHLGNLFGNIAFQTAYEKGEVWLNQLIDYLLNNRNLIIDYLQNKIPNIKAYPVEGTFLMWLDFSKTGLSHKQIKDKLIRQSKLALNDGLTFGKNGEKHFRLNFALPQSKLLKALKKLEIFNQL